MMKRTILPLAAFALLSACGQRESLRPAEGASLPPKAATSPRVATADELLTPPVQTRPGRSDDLLKKSEERQDDRFDLPPPG